LRRHGTNAPRTGGSWARRGARGHTKPSLRFDPKAREPTSVSASKSSTTTSDARLARLRRAMAVPDRRGAERHGPTAGHRGPDRADRPPAASSGPPGSDCDHGGVPSAVAPGRGGGRPRAGARRLRAGMRCLSDWLPRAAAWIDSAGGALAPPAARFTVRFDLPEDFTAISVGRLAADFTAGDRRA